MKRIIALWFVLLVACFVIGNAHAAYLRNIPVTVTQPDGTILHCFASGDEFFNYLHDGNGYTIIQHPQTGYYVYAEKQDGSLVATEFIAGRQDPASKGLQPYALISPQEWMARRKAWDVPDERPQNRDYTPNHGTLNNISIFIRFSDDGQFTNSYSSIDNMFNDVSEGAVSMRSYFRSASYGAIEIPTTFFPGHNGESIISYQDIYPRSYFQPYNAYTNPNGYQEENKAEREFGLLQRAVNYVNSNHPVPTNLNIDYNGDGYVDNVCFIVKGDVGEWNSILWPHKWALYDRNVYINGKRVWTFNFQLADGYFSVSTMCHEMNHSLGAPDLYHYSHIGPAPVGIWDLMQSNTTPPQHCGAYMKTKYGYWIDEIPEITQDGNYTLNPISSAIPTNIAYKVQSDNPDQFYVLEYRDNTSLFETGLPGSGLLIYRIDTRFYGNADYNPDNGIYDEVYIFRPGGSVSETGNLDAAHFSSNVGRTEFNSSTNPYPFFTEGTIDNNIRIYNVTDAGNTISFSVQMSNSGHAITATAAPSIGGTVSGGGTFNSGATCTLTATPSEGYAFVNWTENGNVVSSNSTFSFNVSGDRDLVANFSLSENHWTPEGTNYSGVMSVYGVIQINGIEQYSNQLEVGAFCGDECRGSAIASEFYLTHRYLAIMTVYGEIGHQLTFKLYDHNTGQEFEQVSQETITFTEDGYGNPIEPYILNFTGAATSFHFITAGYWSQASNWSGGVLPGANNEVFIDAPCQLDMNATMNALTVSNGQSLTVQSGKTLNVSGVLTNTSTTGLVIEDGAQLVHASENVSAVVKKNVTGYGTDNGNFILVSNPLTSAVNPELASLYHLTMGNYDLYDWLPNSPDNLNWRNYKEDTFMMLPESYGYLYASQNGVELNFPGTLKSSHYRFSKTVSYDYNDSEHPGWNLIGNPFVCNAYLVNSDNELLPFYRINTLGDGLDAVTSGVIAPMEGVFYHASGNETVYFIRTDFTSQIPDYMISVSANSAEEGSVAGGGTYQQGQSCTVMAAPATGYNFLHWTENGNQVSTSANYVFTVTGNRTLVAHFQAQTPNTYTVNVSANPSVGGTVTGGGTYNQGASCTVTAAASTGYTFLRWVENGTQVSTNANYTFTVAGNRTLVAQFQAQGYTINVSANPTNGGTVSGGGSYNYGQSCTVTATAATGFTFLRWTENGTQVSTNASYSFTVSGNRTLVAQFQAQGYTISVSANPTNGGTVSGSGSYNYGQFCTLTANANSCYQFDHWQDGNTDNPRTISVTANATYTAYFTYNSGGDHGYVDLGLPSGLLWATCNVGADFPEDYGDYFAWGETEPKSDYSWSTYQYCMGSYNTLTKYCNNTNYGYNGFTDLLTTLQPSDDAATAQWGSCWRMPTKTEWQELLNNTTHIWTTQNGVNGRLFTAPNGNSLFLPAAGYRYGTSLHNAETIGYFWSSWLNTGGPGGAWSFIFSSDDCSMYGNSRYIGQSVRPVRSSAQTNVPTGAIDGKFTINASGNKVYFSKGNLQYIGSAGTPYWKFADNQWDYLGDNGQLDGNQNVDRDLFGWGTSGWDNENIFYQPWDTDPSSGSSYGPPGPYDLIGSYANSDWGVYNTIYFGSTATAGWRTMTKNEWSYVLFTRSTTSGIRYAKAKLNNVNGIILLPDNWTASTNLNNCNQNDANFESNVISSSQWDILENAGAVFLPCAGERLYSIFAAGSIGYYWTSSNWSSTPNNAYGVFFSDSGVSVSGSSKGRQKGDAVRLVFPVE